MPNSDAGSQVAELTVSWKQVAPKVGRSVDYLKQLQANGTLPVSPIKLGHSIAYTPSMLDELRGALPPLQVRRRG